MGSPVIQRRDALRRTVCLGLWLLLGCGPGPELAVLPDQVPPPAPARLTGVVFQGYSAASRSVEVRAALAQVDFVKRVAQLERVRIEFQDPSRGKVEIRAQKADFLLDSDDFVLHEHVEGVTAEGERFTSSQVRYQHAQQRLWTDQSVRLYRDDLVVEGEGMEVDLSTRRIRLTGGVKARTGRP